MSLRYTVQLTPRNEISLRSPSDVTVSTLNDGRLYKIAVDQAGIHKITYDFLANELGVDVNQINPQQLQILGDFGGRLPYNVETTIVDDVTEMPIWVKGEADGRFDQNDYLLFYAQGADVWQYNADQQQFNLQKNIYDAKNYYFLKIGSANGKRVPNRESLPQGALTVTTFDDFARFEQEDRNVLHDWVKTQGSGQFWLGDHFKNLRKESYNEVFTFDGLVPQSDVKINARMALRALQRTTFFMDINNSGQLIESGRASQVIQLSGDRDNEISYAHNADLSTTIPATQNAFSFSIEYPQSSPNDGSEGWLDYIQINVRRSLKLYGAQTTFRDQLTRNANSATYTIGDMNAGSLIWDITDPLSPTAQEYALSGSQGSFSVSSNALRTFVVFSPDDVTLTPQGIGEIENQNIHGITDVDMAIIYHSDFKSAAERLAQHRTDFSDISIALVSLDQVMNEFASGAKDPTAIRNFAKMLYDRDPRFEHLLLVGDGSFDSRDIYESGGDYIPTFQSISESYNPLSAFPADDYFGILEANTELGPLNGRLNLSVGRLPVRTIDEANAVVNKIIHYDTHPQSFADWRNRLVFLADDEDRNEHLIFTDDIANEVYATTPTFNLEKIYIDAFPQVSTPGGNRFPSVNEAIDKAIFKGALLFTYLGHGGPNGLAQERILNIESIKNWDNMDALTIFMTATCSFAGYDDFAFTTAGEELFLNPKGGAVALLTTTRAVYSSQNADLTEKALQELFKPQNGSIPTLGQAMRNAKNRISFASTNTRKFTLLGDPSQRPAMPTYQVKTLTINGRQVSESTLDTLNALDKVTIEGVVLDPSGQVYESFNGDIIPTIYDKALAAKTLGQDARSFSREYIVQKNVLFKGRSTVNQGRFSFSYVVPKDINYAFGNGKISYYAADKGLKIDASGAFDDIIIGGANENGLTDDQGPLVEVFMNTEDFVFGNITDENPVLLVKLQDENGINVVGNSIGHDLEGTLDEDTQNSLLLNDFYEAAQDDYTRGEVRFPLFNLEEGRHTMRVKAWDVANNSAEGYTEFVVANSSTLALEHVLNFPNPFTDRTCFQFDHNLTDVDLEVMVQIFTVSGRLVKTLQTNIFSDGAIRQDDCIEWDGKDDFGDQLARGVYLYKVKIRTNGPTILTQESDFEKLVILK